MALMITLMLLIKSERREMAMNHHQVLDRMFTSTKETFREFLNEYDGEFNARGHTKQFDPDAQDEKRKAAATLKGIAAENSFDTLERNAKLDHGKALIEAGWSLIQDLILPETFLDQQHAVEAYRFSLNSTPTSTQTAGAGSSTDNHRGVTSHGGTGSQPSKRSWPEHHWHPKSHVYMADLLATQGYLHEQTPRRGRKPGCDAAEANLWYYETRANFDWSAWWMKVGGFEAWVLG